MTTELTTQAQPFSLAPRSLDEAFRLADMLADSDIVPKDYKGKPGNIIVAMQWGFEVGLKPLQALQNIAVINGRPSMWGDAVMALVRSSSLCEYVLEDFDSAGTAICRAKRRGEPEQVRTFSDDDAKKAGLSGKQGPWSTSPKRMKQMRARSFALRDVFADVLKGMDIAEVVVDYSDLSEPPQLAQDGKKTEPDVRASWIAKAAATTTDAEAAKVWAEGGAAFAAAKDRAGYAAFRDAVAAHRKSLKAALDERTVDADPAPVDDDFVRGMDSVDGAANA